MEQKKIQFLVLFLLFFVYVISRYRLTLQVVTEIGRDLSTHNPVNFIWAKDRLSCSKKEQCIEQFIMFAEDSELFISEAAFSRVLDDEKPMK